LILEGYLRVSMLNLEASSLGVLRMSEGRMINLTGMILVVLWDVVPVIEGFRYCDLD
jgi:hypothetical protein